jgi:hypothetical protein
VAPPATEQLSFFPFPALSPSRILFLSLSLMQPMTTVRAIDPQGHAIDFQHSSCKLLRARAVWFGPPIFAEEDLPPTWQPLPKHEETVDGEAGKTIEFPEGWTVELR